MQSEPLARPLAKATRRLSALTKKQINTLSLLDCTIMLHAVDANPIFASLQSQLVSRLRRQVSANWIRQSNLRDVFAVLVALWNQNPTYVSGDYLTAAIQRLVAAETAVGGPYRSDGSVSISANVQIAAFMRLVAKPLPNLETFIRDLLTSNQITDADSLYALAQANPSRALVNTVAWQWQQKKWHDVRHKVVALIILRKKIPTPQIQQTLTAICRNRHLPPVTAALIIKALSTLAHSAPVLPNLQRRHVTIVRAAKNLVRARDEPLRSNWIKIVNQIANGDTKFEITLLPYFIAHRLATPTNLTARQYTDLGLASLCGWIAYTIYDDFLDNEGKPDELPIANIAMRASLQSFARAIPSHDFGQYVATTFDGMDQANAWETAYCRFVVQGQNITITALPYYGNRSVLADRSFAHALAPLAVLLPHTRNRQQIELAFRHYLIARQLNDDLQDWIQDLHAGHASYVVTQILRDLRVRPGTHHLATLLPKMQRQFRQKTLSRICQRILRHTALARQAFTKSALLCSTNKMFELLDALELTTQQSIDTYLKANALSKFRLN